MNHSYFEDDDTVEKMDPKLKESLQINDEMMPENQHFVEKQIDPETDKPKVR